jgi:hypothetical protein
MSANAGEKVQNTPKIATSEINQRKRFLSILTLLLASKEIVNS